MPEALFCVRNPFVDVENEDELTITLNDLANLGWNSLQWGLDKPKFNLSKVKEKFPDYDFANEQQQDAYFSAYYDSLPDQYFIEAFGKDHRGYLRSDQPTLLQCAQHLLAQAQTMAHCLSHDWEYTHSNGFKTCKICNTFEPCTIDEAKANYESGNIEIDNHHALYFHRTRALCACGSHDVHYLSDSMFHETHYRCAVCRTFLPARFDNSFSRLSHLLIPTDDNFETGDLAPTHRLAHHPQKIVKFGVGNWETTQKKITRYIHKMMNHYQWVLDGDLQDEAAFWLWLSPHLTQCIQNSNLQIEHEGQRYTILDVTSFSLSPLSFSAKLGPAHTLQPTPEELFLSIATALVGPNENEEE